MSNQELIAVYDACVLYPAPLRDLLIRLARTGLFRARWTDLIHDEWIRNVLGNRSDLTAEQLERTRQLMNAAVRDCLVTGYEHRIEDLNLPDPDDRHVLAAALEAQAQVIVTYNLRDFPTSALHPHQTPGRIYLAHHWPQPAGCTRHRRDSSTSLTETAQDTRRISCHPLPTRLAGNRRRTPPNLLQIRSQLSGFVGILSLPIQHQADDAHTVTTRMVAAGRGRDGCVSRPIAAPSCLSVPASLSKQRLNRAENLRRCRSPISQRLVPFG